MAKNTDQKVGENYAKNYDAIFNKDVASDSNTGKYVYDRKSGCVIKIDSNIPSNIKAEMESKTSTLGQIAPITIQKKDV